ncbi:LacI family transcriptional regulator [Nocardioides rotundus]|uniref:LacI family DNA-binding transcriptional regulator n=1 Tax=Nocardioides rotundus TaxID=1774216 RepID=UPI001CBEA200|nr:LacI family DNA-binding transcriptional regulator [Nocardioides rotundus]UAL30305.1 LacI family transcriptional regulator [Nocardioides rotundus]
MSTIDDVARRAGVSRATASRALTGAGSAAPATVTRVRDAARELGYRPNAVARSLRTTRTSTIGLIVSDVRNPFFAELVHGIEQAAEECGWSLMVGNADESTERQDGYVQTLLAHQVDGLIATPQGDGSGALSEALAAGVPTVFVDRRVAGLDVPVVASDGDAGVRAMVEHLAGLGHRRIGVIAGPQEASTGRDRLRAVRAALRRHGLATDDELVRFGDFQLDTGVRCAGELVELADPPDVIFAADNLMALGAFQELRRRGVRVGEDMGLAAFDDLDWFSLVDPPITAVAQDTRALGNEAVRLLREVREGGQPADVTLPVDLRVRRSCGEGRR